MNTSRPPGRAARLRRWTAFGLLPVLTALLAFAAVPARYLRAELLDTDRYVQTMAPLADDPAIRAELTTRITERITERLDLTALTTEALNALDERAPRLPDAVTGLAPVLAAQAEDFIHDTVADLIASPRFRTLWNDANRRAHHGLVALLTGDTRPGLEVDDGTVALALGPLVDAARTELLDRGFRYAEKIPTVETEIVLIESPGLARAQRITAALDTAAVVLPIAALLCAVLALVLAPAGERPRAAGAVGLAVALAMAVAAVAIAVGRAVYLREIPAEGLSPPAAAAVFDTLAVPLRTTLRAVFVLAVAVLVAAFLTGPTRPARALRQRFAALGTRHTDGHIPAPVASVATAHRTALRATVLVTAAAVLILRPYPSGVYVAITLGCAALVLLVLEVLTRPGPPETGTTERSPR